MSTNLSDSKMLDEAYSLDTRFLKSEAADDTKFEVDDEVDVCSAQELERIKEECKVDKQVKPPYSYIALITMAILRVTILLHLTSALIYS